MDIGLYFEKEHRFVLIAGPCVVESKTLLEEVAGPMCLLTKQLGIPYVFKASYKKANRSSHSSFSGIGDLQALQYLHEIRQKYQVPILTDVHSPEECEMASYYTDILQIPAFLCRQTELLVAAGKTGLWVNIKKGQFLSPEAMSFAIDKVRSTGNDQILATERGSCFGYRDLIVDFRSIPIMQSLGVPVIMDCTHSVQQPNQSGGITGGTPQHISTMAKAAIATGANGIFIETHPRPYEALSDGANMLPQHQMEDLLIRLLRIKEAL